MCSLVSLDRATAKRAFDGFIERWKVSAHQYEFLNMMIEHLTARAVMDPGCFTSRLLRTLISRVAGVLAKGRLCS